MRPLIMSLHQLFQWCILKNPLWAILVSKLYKKICQFYLHVVGSAVLDQKLPGNGQQEKRLQ